MPAFELFYLNVIVSCLSATLCIICITQPTDTDKWFRSKNTKNKSFFNEKTKQCHNSSWSLIMRLNYDEQEPRVGVHVQTGARGWCTCSNKLDKRDV